MASLPNPYPFESILEHLNGDYDDRLIRQLRRDLMSQEDHSPKAVIVGINRTLKSVGLERLTDRAFASLFGVSVGTIFNILHERPVSDRSIPPARRFSDEQEATMVQHLIKQFDDLQPLTVEDFRDYIATAFHEDVSRMFVESFLQRHHDEIQLSTCKPQELKRIALTKELAEAYVEELRRVCVGVPACLVYNLDESGCQEWVDAKPKLALVPTNTPGEKLVYAVKRDGKLVSVMPCISLSGLAPCPLVVVRRKTLDKDLYTKGLKKGIDAFILPSESGYVTTSIFIQWLEDIFVPWLTAIRYIFSCPTDPAVVICDSFIAHTHPSTLEILNTHNIKLIHFPAHSSHIFQPLDIAIFGVMKRLLPKQRSLFETGSQGDHVARVVQALQDSTTPHRNQAAFLHAGITASWEEELPKAKLDEVRIAQRLSLI